MRRRHGPNKPGSCAGDKPLRPAAPPTSDPTDPAPPSAGGRTVTPLKAVVRERLVLRTRRGDWGRKRLWGSFGGP